MADRIIVLKFGSSVLGTRTDLLNAVHEIYRWYRGGWKVVAVVSAIGRATETLLAEARELSGRPQPDATAELLSTGERHCAALLGIALDRAGVKASVVDPREIGMIVAGTSLDSEPVAVDCARTLARLSESAVVVIPGFFAYSEAGKLHLLGRGGSDLSAVFLAQALNARCRLIKDVDGVYESDPAQSTSALPRRFVSLGYADALSRARQLIQAKAVHFIERHAASVEVASIASGYASTIGRHECILAAATTRQPLSVLLLGLGTVGLGVYQRIVAAPTHFRIIGVLVRDRAKHSADGIPMDLIHDSVDTLANLRPNVVVDALPGFQPSHSLARYYLADGVAVVTANKTLLAAAGPELQEIAYKSNAKLHCSAAVGGSAPMLERLRQESGCGPIQSIGGVLNGTCNYILDRCMEGLDFDAAVAAAQANGFAEADPSEDLSGRDAGRKLQILTRLAFGTSLDSLEIERLDADTVIAARSSLREGETLRIIARARQHEGVIAGQVRLEKIACRGGFASVTEEWNRLMITRATGESVSVAGRGAGRWPTTEVVMADLFELTRD